MSSTVEARSGSQAGGINLVAAGAICAVAGLGALALAFSQGRTVALQSYHFGFIFWICMTLGCFGLTLLHHAVRGSWGLSILRLMEAGGSGMSFLAMAVLFLPIVFGAGDLYVWADPAAVRADEVLQHKSGYLNLGFFALRAAVYFIIWALIAYLLRRSTLRQDRTGDLAEQQYRTNLGTPAIVFFVLSVTFAVTDWVMSLDPRWSSTIYGFWFVIGQALMALAFGTIVVTLSARRRPYSEIVSPQLTRDLGNMMFTCTMVWAYFTLSQFLITWSGNLPEFITYYVRRRTAEWNYLGAFNVIAQFFIPWTLLLAPKVKARPGLLAAVAIWLLAMRLPDLLWNVVPFYGRAVAWSDFAALVGIGGVWLIVFGLQLRRAPLLPVYDRRLQEALHDGHA